MLLSLAAERGLVTAIAQGEVTITASASGLSTTARIKVTGDLLIQPRTATQVVQDGGALSISFPSDALDSPIAFDLSAISMPWIGSDFMEVPGTVYQLKPVGTQLSAPARVTIRYSGEGLSTDTALDDPVLLYWDGSVWSPVGNFAVDHAAHTFSGDVRMLSVVGLFYRVPGG